jgi:hypothetical protein
MIYMWVPMVHWVPWLSVALAGYFALETIALATSACRESFARSARIEASRSTTQRCDAGTANDEAFVTAEGAPRP